MKKMKRIFAFDLDGTLLKSDSTLAKSTLNAIKLIKDNGDIPVIVTGRHITTAKYIVDESNIKYFIGVNGALVLNTETMVPINQSFMMPEIIKMIIKYMVDLNLGFSLYTKNKIYIYNYENGNKDIQEFMKEIYSKRSNEIFIKEIKDLPREKWDEIFKTTYKIIGILSEKQSVDVVNEIKTIFGKFTNIYPASSNTVEINHAGDNKWKGIKILQEYIKKTEHNDSVQICAFGDNFNDWEMLENSDIAVVMDNANEIIKEIATFVTDSNDKDGIWNGVKKIYNI